MNREHLHLLINRAVDGAASAAEREELARALRADPMLRGEFEELEVVNAATASLFRQLALPEDFSKRVMRRIQGANVPADAEADGVRLPSVRPLGARASRAVSMQRRRARVYAIVAFVSAAAALVLALGVITGAFSGSTAKEDTTTAEGGRGVPDEGGSNRTGPSTPQSSPKVEPKGGEQVDSQAPDKPSPGPIDSQPKPDKVRPHTPDPGLGEEVVKPAPERPEAPEPAAPEDEPEPNDTDVVEQPAPSPDTSPEPTQPSPDDRKTAPRPEIGRMLVLSGRVDLVGGDGSLSRLNSEQPVHHGDRLRTRYNAVVMLQLAGGDVTLGKDTQVLLDCENALRLEECDGKEKGMVAIDRSAGHSGDSFAILCGDYSLYLTDGAAVMERKRKAVSVSKAVGSATLTHNTLGTIQFPADSGYEAEVEFGKEMPAPRAKAVQLPAICGETRSQVAMLEIADTLAERKFASGRERSYVNSNLPGKLDSLMTWAVTTDAVVGFLKHTIARVELDGAAIVKMTGEVEIAFAEVVELTPETIIGHASRAAMVAENFDQWHNYFYRLMRPPVEPKDPKTPSAPVPVPVPDCPNDKKVKRVDEPPRKVKQVPPNNTDGTEKTDEKPTEKSAEKDAEKPKD